jgi:single-stranded-DNA-specific exonuclease
VGTSPKTEFESPAVRWVLPEMDLAAVGRFATEMKLGMPAAQALWNRGHRDPDGVRTFLSAPIEALHDPFLLAGMRDAVQRLAAAVRAKEPVLLYGDYDVDGTSSVVVLKKAIEICGGVASFHVPHRLKDGYGMRSGVVDDAASQGVKLIVSVDTGIRAADVVKYAGTLGIDVIVTDHHLPEAALPPAVAVLNPHRPDCTYPDKNLCGAGVAFKLVHALLLTLEWQQDRIRRLLDSFLKLVAIATIADVVPLTGENRVIVKRGLAGLKTVKNPGLRALLDVAGLSEGAHPSAGQVAFRIAPRINAAGRMATANDVIDLFTTEDPERARVLAAQLHQLNQERQEAEASIVRAILEECEKTPVTPGQFALVFSGEGWHRGVVGIVASRIVERFYRPVFVLGQDGELAQGSGRSIRPFHLLEALESMPDLFAKFGGHRQAAGLTMPAAQVSAFRERLNTYASTRLTAEDLCPTLDLDGEIAFSDLNDGTAAEVLELAPFGFGNPSPVFAVRGAEIAAAPEPLREKGYLVRLRHSGRTMRMKSWGFAARDYAAGDRVDVAITIEDDPYSASRGYSPWCAALKEIRRSR